MKKAWLTLSALVLMASAGALQAKEWKEIRFATDPSYAPFESKAPDGSLVGFDIDLGNAICAHLKVKCVWMPNDFDGMIPGLKARKFDGVISSMTVTEARKKEIDFTDKLFTGPSAMISKKGAGLEPTADSLKGKTVGVEQGTIQETFAKTKLEPAGVNVKSYQNQDQVYSDLVSGRLDASLQDLLQAEQGFLTTDQGKGFEISKPVHDPLMPADIAIGIRKGNDELRAMLNKGIKAIHDDGTYDKLQKKYFGDLDIYND